MRNALAALDREIAARCEAVANAFPDWPCRRGCDGCCRHLAAVPQVNAAEAVRLARAVAALPPAIQKGIRDRLASLPAEGPLVCPLLDLEQGACLVYADRPLACRTYGFYVERDLGLYCGRILARVESGDLVDVVWGNAEAVAARAVECGPAAPLPFVLDGAPDPGER